MEKEYGGLSLIELKRLSEILQSFQELKADLLEAVAGNDHPFFNDLPLGYGWADLYSYPFMTTVYGLAYHLGMTPEIKKSAASGYPQSYLLDNLDTFKPDIKGSEQTDLSPE